MLISLPVNVIMMPRLLRGNEQKQTATDDRSTLVLHPPTGRWTGRGKAKGSIRNGVAVDELWGVNGEPRENKE